MICSESCRSRQLIIGFRHRQRRHHFGLQRFAFPEVGRVGCGLIEFLAFQNEEGFLQH